MVVTGASMQPSFEEGDRVVAVAAWLARPFSAERGHLGKGDVVLVSDPRHAGVRRNARTLLKRLHAVHSHGIDVLGDNPLSSTDSRHFGLVPWQDVIGLVVYRYFPPERVSWWPGRDPAAPDTADPPTTEAL